MSGRAGAGFCARGADVPSKVKASTNARRRAVLDGEDPRVGRREGR